MTQRIAFIDTSLVDYQSLEAALHPSVQVVLISPLQDGWLQIANALARRGKLDASGIDAIDIISHGAPGSVMLGSGALNANTLPAYAATLAEIGCYLSADADILLYGCDVGAGSAGTALLDQLAAITGANIAASTDITGAAAMGGNWRLEASSGLVNATALQVPAYSGILALSIAPLVNEFQVNTTTASEQEQPSITGLTDGGYVVSWISYNQDGYGFGIYAQQYNSSGAAVGGEVRVNTTTLGNQGGPSITGLTDGGYVVSWSSWYQDDGMSWIYTQHYNASGTAMGGEVQVNTTTGFQERPSITGLTDGGYVVSWMSYNGDVIGWDIYAQQYNASGTAVGGVVQVNTTTFNGQQEPSITALSDGGYVVSWMSFNQDISSSDIYAQRYNASGTAIGGEVQVNTTTSNYLYFPSITALTDGGYVVSWTSYGQDGSVWGIYAQRYNVSGAAFGGEVQVNTTTLSDQYYPSITGLTDGGYVVSWTSFNQDGSEWGIYTQRYDATSTPVGGEVQVNTTTLSHQNQPSITGLTDGGYVVSWMSFGQDGSSTGVYAQRFDVGGNRVSMALQGDAGDNNLVWTGSSPVILDGGAGNDILTGGASDDIFTGGAGNDALNGRAGNDTAIYSGSSAGYTFSLSGNSLLITDINLADGNDGVDTLTDVESLSFTDGTIQATKLAEFQVKLQGDAGNNTLTWTGSEDIILAGDSGNDVLQGGDGNDTLNDIDSTGLAASNILAAGAGNDTIHVLQSHTSSITTVSGGSGRDTYLLQPNSIGQLLVSDFAAGISGDILNINTLLTSSSGFSGGNPFDATLGYLRLLQQGADTLLQWDQDAATTATNNWQTVITLQNVTAATLTIDNFSPAFEPYVTVTGTTGDDNLAGGAGNDALIGGAGNDTIAAGDGTDAIVYTLGGEANTPTDGFDTVDGGAGTDTVTVTGSNAGDAVVIEAAGSSIEADNAASTSATPLMSMTGVEEIVLNLGAGNDSATVAGDFTATDLAPSTITIRGGSGNDTLSAAGVTSAHRVAFYGDAGDDTLTGGNGNDLLDGGSGADSLNGGVGADRLVADALDTLAGGGGSDTFVLGNDIDSTPLPGALITDFASGAGGDVLDLALLQQASAALGLSGNLFTPSIAGLRLVQAGADTQVQWDRDGSGAGFGWQTVALLQGVAANSLVAANFSGGLEPPSNIVPAITSNGGGATASVSVTENTALVTALAALDPDIGQVLSWRISGGEDAALFEIAGNNELRFVAAPDFENLPGAGATPNYQLTVEVSDGAGGVDSQALTVSVANLMGQTFAGGNGAQTLTGGGEEDTLTGGNGNDQLNGGAGNDQLEGGAGNDQLNGGTGNDTMYGGLGNDTYVVDATDDSVVENAGSGRDTVQSSISYILGANLEDLILTGTANNNGTGNALNNVLIGNSDNNTLAGNNGNDSLNGGLGDDMLNGGSGQDTLIGGVGNDTYVIDDTGDTANELSAQGIDTVQSYLGTYTLTANIENLMLLGAAITGNGNGLNNVITGNSLNNVLRGGAGNDQLFGLGGNDTLTGGTGNDQFVFSTTPAAGNVDRVTDFIAGQDQLVLDALVFTGLNLHNQALDAAMFRSGAGITTAADADDRVIFNTTNGALYYDADGAGGTAAVQFATIVGVSTLDPGSIWIMN